MAESKTFLKGQLLLDGGKLAGSFFHRTVVLICDHNEEGAMGLVLNRATENEVGEMIQADLPEKIHQQTLFLGGPVQTTALSFLHSDSFIPDPNVMDQLSLGHSLEDLIEIGQSLSTACQVRVFAGYAGWSAGQLESEMERDAWVTHPARLDLIFSQKVELLWKTIMTEKGGIYKLFSDAPDDLSSN